MSKYKINIIDVLERKERGETNRDIAEAFGVPTHAIENALKATGNTGMGRGTQRSRASGARAGKRTLIDRLLDINDELVIERGLNGGYIVTVSDNSGPEEFDINEALFGAYRLASVKVAS